MTKVRTDSLRIDERTARILVEHAGVSVGLWRAAEVAAMREWMYEPPVLDLGCGDGLVTSLVTRQVAMGIDPCRRSLERASERGIYQLLEACPIETAALPKSMFRTVIANSVLEYVPEVDTALARISRTLKRGGRLIFTAPTEAMLRSMLLPVGVYKKARIKALDYLNLWTLAKWHQHLCAAGFEIEAVRPYLRPEVIRAWDRIDLLESVKLGRKPVIHWLKPEMVKSELQRLIDLDLASPSPGGGRLIVARKVA